MKLGLGLSSYNNTIFNPAYIQDIGFWVDFSDISAITETADNVSQVDDKSGNNLHLTAIANQPTTSIASLNGLNGLRFIAAERMFSDFEFNDTGYTVFMVSRVNNSLAVGASFPSVINVSGLTNYQSLFLRKSTGNFEVKTVSDTNDTRPIFNYETEFPAGTAVLQHISIGLENNLSYANGILKSSVTRPTIASILTTGAIQVGDSYAGDIFEIIVYNRELSSFECNMIGDYLSKKYALPWSNSNTG